MTFTDFHQNFQRMEICYLGPDSMLPEQVENNWECKLMEGAWKRNVNAGGCRNYPSKCDGCLLCVEHVQDCKFNVSVSLKIEVPTIL